MTEADVRRVICSLEALGWLSLVDTDEDLLVVEVAHHLIRFPNGTYDAEKQEGAR